MPPILSVAQIDQTSENMKADTSSEVSQLIPPRTPPRNYGPETEHRDKRETDIDEDEHDDDDSEDFDDEVAKQNILRHEKDFTISYDASRGYRGTELKLSSFARPHMRAMHASWICFFASFFTQFAMAPLLPVIGDSLNLSKRDVWKSNCLMMVGGIPMRFLLGPLCDKYGARLTMTTMLALCGIVCGLSGLLVVNVASLTWTRFVIGGKHCLFLSSLKNNRFLSKCPNSHRQHSHAFGTIYLALDTFVPCQYWITVFFVREVAGSAMALASGLG